MCQFLIHCEIDVLRLNWKTFIWNSIWDEWLVEVGVNYSTWCLLVNTVRNLDQLWLRLVALGVSGHLVLAGSQESEVVTILN